MPVEKNQEYIVEIVDNGFEGEGIAKINNFTIFIPNALKGEKIKILVVKVLKSHAFGKILEILEASKYRTEVDCKTYKRCGGCSIQHMSYKKQLDIKWNRVKDCISQKGGISEELENYPIGM